MVRHIFLTIAAFSFLMIAACGNDSEASRQPVKNVTAALSSSAESSSAADTASVTVSSSSESGYKLTVRGAPGTGRFAAGAVIALNPPAQNDSGSCFSGWEVSPSKYKASLKTQNDSARFTMPADSVTVEAMFRSCFDGAESVVIGNLRWMTKTLNVWTLSGSSCYGGKNKNCKAYGRLYNFETAKKVCSSGWRLPTDEEWSAMVSAVGDNAAAKLKAHIGWAADGDDSGNGSDDFGFAALPSGLIYQDSSMYVGHHAYFWTATEKDADAAWFRSVSYDNDDVYRYFNLKTARYSVRCVKDK